MSEKTGVPAVLSGIAREISENAAAADLPAEQLDLLALAPRGAARYADERRILNSLQSGAGVEGGKKPAHRHKGSQNVLTRKVKEVIMATLGDPAIARLRPFYHFTEEELAARWKMEIGEVVKLRDKVLSDLQDLFHAKATPLDDEGKPIPQFTFNVSGDKVAVVMPKGAPVPPWLTDAEVAQNVAQRQQNQGVTLDAGAQSHEAKSHEKDK